MHAKLARLENVIGHKFEKLEYLERAVTHRSWAYENAQAETEEAMRTLDNELLEFVGDSVLGLVVAEQLYLRNPKATEGDLTLMKHNLVSGASLAEIAENLGLGEYLRLGGSESRNGRQKHSLLTNALEAVIGAVFLDSSYVTTRHVVTRLMETSLKSVTAEASIDFKSRLQTDLQANRQKTADYNLIKTEGPPHDRTFYVEVIWETGKARGVGNSIKSAEMVAAEEALKTIGRLTAHQ